MKKEKKKVIEIEEHTQFHFAHMENVQRVSTALAQAGYFVNITRDQEFYVVCIYKHSM